MLLFVGALLFGPFQFFTIPNSKSFLFFVVGAPLFRVSIVEDFKLEMFVASFCWAPLFEVCQILTLRMQEHDGGWLGNSVSSPSR